MSVRDIIYEIRNNIKSFENLKSELEKRKDKLKAELKELMLQAKELKLLENVCVRIGRGCSIEVCYTGIRVSRGIILVDEESPKLYLLDGYCSINKI